jgi:hypothetical protein
MIDKSPLALGLVVNEGNPVTSNQSGPKVSACALVLLMLVANLAFLAVAVIPTDVEKPSSRSSSRAPEACPSSAVGWTITGTHVYTGACTISGGATSVAAGADITFEKVIMSISGTQYFYNYASWKILNSTITGSLNWYGIYGNTGNTLMKVENSTIKGWYQYGVRATTGARIEVSNSTFIGQAVTAQYAIQAASATSGYITYNKIINATYSAIYMSLSSSVVVHNNTVNCFSVSYGFFLNSYAGKFDNNTITTGTTTQAIRAYSSAMTSFWNNKAKSTSGIRYYQYGQTISAYRCNFTGAQGTDVSVDNSGKLKAYDTYINSATTGTGASVETYWRANISVKWQSNDQPVSGARVDLTDNRNVVLQSGIYTDAQGMIKNIYMMEFIKDSKGKMNASPYWINATMTKNGKDFFNYTKGNMTNATNNFNVVLDDIPPPLLVTAPLDALITNSTWVIIKGWTEHNNSKLWPVKVDVRWGTTVLTPKVWAAGNFTQNLSLAKEGKYSLTVTATDSDQNTKVWYLNITRDTVCPPLNLDRPSDATLTNISTIEVAGATEPGALLTINNVTVTLQNTGAFTYQYQLAEGNNVITVRSEDKGHNRVEKTVNVKLDTKLPMLNVAEPKDMSKTNQPKIRLQGTTEARATVTINGNPVLLSATSFMSNLDLIEGDNAFTVRSCDLASNCNSTVVHVFLDTAPPTIDVTSPKDELLTKVGHVTVLGTVEDCAKVNVNGKPVTYIGNEFAYDVTLKEGKNVILVEATDDVNNKATVSLIVNLDSIPPILTLNEPKDGVTVNKAEINIDGTTETDAAVTVAGKKVTNANGGYITKYTLVEGLNEIKVSATDLAGNIVNITVKVTLDTKVALQVKGLTQGMAIQTTNQTCNISGTADKDASVYVNDLPVKVKSDGTFKTEVPLDLGTNNISVLAEDPLGNRVTYSYQVVRKSPPSPPPNPIISGEGPLGGLLVPLLIVVAIVAAVGIGGGLYMRKKSKAAQTALPPAAPVVAPPAAAPTPAAPTMMAPPPPTTYYDPQQAAQPAQPQYAPPPPPPPPPVANYPVAEATPFVSSEAMDLYTEAQRTLAEAEANGQDVSRARTHLRVAQTFLNKGNSEKVILYSKKALGRN